LYVLKIKFKKKKNDRYLLYSKPNDKDHISFIVITNYLYLVF